MRRAGQLQVEDLLRTREAKGLRWALTGRFVLLTLGALVTPAISPTTADFAYTLSLMAVGMVVCGFAYRLARREERLDFAGLICLCFDIVVLFTLPISWYKASGGPEMGSSFLLKNDLILLSLLLIGANGLTLRPLYPLVMTAASFVLYATIWAFSYPDPRFILSSSIGESVMGAAVHPGLFAWRMVTIGFFGGLFAWLAGTGNRTVREAVELEHANDEIKRQHAELVMQGRLSALAGLVAGVAHEVNTPLGVLSSSVQTVGSCAARLSAIPSGDSRILGILNQNVVTAGTAVDRISDLVTRLKDFAGLDQSDVQTIDLEPSLDRTIDLIGPEIKGEAHVERTYGSVPALKCRSKEMSQVFYTLITNAFQAMEGNGTLNIVTSLGNGEVVIEISDTGRGLAADQLATIFDIQLAAKDGRIGMRLGLPMARYIVESHGGSIRARSKVGQGTSFRIGIPATN